ncbi:hypothetical protein Dda_1955 [Drechslerella dactyloides]|uniref:Uncharacterized protein n=1 Tax=Drechslerella dactyloides TaxID=74499 RepID=A0AAD6NM85_DREDA|nr:hypothetical protein Dda_1955 [Drechslerella dactyloides]
MATAVTIQIPQVAIVDVDSSRPQTPVSEHQSSAPSSPTAARMDSLKVEDPASWWKRRRSSSVSTVETLPIYPGPNSPPNATRNHGRSNSMTPSIASEVPSYRTIPEDHDTTTYHLYRLGHKGGITVHEVADKSLGLLPRATFADGTPRPLPGFWKRNCLVANPKTARRPDHPKFDPRLPAYCVHKPIMPAFARDVPMTLRRGPNKHSPIVCRFDGNFAWRKWYFDFEDINGEGVVDERGVIAEDYPRKGIWRKSKMSNKPSEVETEGKTDSPKGEPNKAARNQKNSCMLSKGFGLAWSLSQRANGKKRVENGKQADQNRETVAEKLKPADTPVEPSETTADIIAPVPVRPVPVINIVEEPPLEAGQKEEEETKVAGPTSQASTSAPSPPPAAPARPVSARTSPELHVDTSRSITLADAESSDKIEMIWENKLHRQYSFTYRDIKFFWKGTSTLKDEHSGSWGAMNRFNHLKLVAELPDDEPEEASSPQVSKSPTLSPDSAEKPGFLLRRRSSISSISSMFSRKSGASTKAPKKELVMATYTTLWGKRKAGRLAVDNTSIDKIVQIIAAKSPTSFAPVLKRRSSSFSEELLSPASLSPPSKSYHAHVFPTPNLPQFPVEVEIFEKQRLKELIVATCIAMANSEREKRHATIELTFLLLEIIQNIPMS